MEQNQQKLSRASKDPANPVLYFQPEYLKTQRYSQLKVINSHHFFSCFAIEGHIAKSLPKSPIGGIYYTGDKISFGKFYAHLETELKRSGVKEIIINQPPPYYKNFVPTDWLLNAGFQSMVSETNQFIVISGEYATKLHRMEQRKLKSKSAFSIRKTSSIREVHRFIAECRKHKGLEINIPEAKLLQLFEAFPDRYEIFEVRKSGKLAAAAIMTLPITGIAYYYLPASHPDFKSQSPMVSLLNYIYGYYHTINVNYLDLGISSVDGKLQKSLFDFKSRMGAESAPKPFLHKKI